MSRASRSWPDPRDVPNYSPTAAARFLGLPTSTLRSWTRGWTYRTESGEERRGEPLIELHDSASNELSFTNLVEAHVLSAIRRHHGVSMPRVRQALARRLFLFTRTEGADQPPVVLIDPRISFGRPVLAGTGIPTEILAGRFNAGETIEELAEDYGCESSLIQEAIRIKSRAA